MRVDVPTTVWAVQTEQAPQPGVLGLEVREVSGSRVIGVARLGHLPILAPAICGACCGVPEICVRGACGESIVLDCGADMMI